MKLLLLSNSTMHHGGYLDHAIESLTSFLSGVSTLTFVPYALHDHDAYTARVRKRFQQLGIDTVSVHETAEGQTPVDIMRQAEAIFIGGGNTFRLLNALYTHRLVEAIRQRVADGAPYIGSSAGTNIATRSIHTTNDMPIVQPPNFIALGFLPFNINPHYVDADPSSTHMGETRLERICEFHEEHNVPVLGMREGTWLHVVEQKATLHGDPGALLFRRGQPPQPLESGEPLDELLRSD